MTDAKELFLLLQLWRCYDIIPYTSGKNHTALLHIIFKQEKLDRYSHTIKTNLEICLFVYTGDCNYKFNHKGKKKQSKNFKIAFLEHVETNKH